MTAVQPVRSTPSSRGSRRAVAPAAVLLVGVAACGFALGGATSFAQGLLPDALRPLANSSATWTLLTALLVLVTRARLRLAAVLGLVGLVAMVLGYQAVSTMRGFPTSEELFLAAAVVVGPLVGVAASELRGRGLPAGLGAALLAGVAIGEAVYGLVVVVASTGWIAWAVLGLVGLALLIAVLRRVPGPRDRLLSTALGAAVATAFPLAYAAAGGIPL